MHHTNFGSGWPYTDMYTLNLDWILAKMREIPGMIESAVSSVVVPNADVYPTYALAREADLPAGTIFRTANFRDTDGNNATYRVITGSAFGGDGIIYGSGTRAVCIDPVVYPEAYGAVGDGTTNDTQAIFATFHSPVIAFKSQGMYRVTSTINAQGPLFIQGNGATIVRDMQTPVKTLNIIGGDVYIDALRIRDGANVVDDKTAMVVVIDDADMVRLSGCDFVSSHCKTNWYLSISAKNIYMDSCLVDSHLGATEWGDACHIVKADTCHIFNCTFIGADDGLAFVPQGNVDMTDGPIRDISVIGCYISSPLYSGLKIGRYKASDLYAEPDTALFMGCTFADCDRWVSLIQSYETWTRTDVIFDSCIFRDNHSKDNQSPINTTTKDVDHGGGYHVQFNSCSIYDHDPNNVKPIFNLSSMSHLAITGCSIRCQAGEVIGSGRSKPSIVDVTVTNNVIEHTGDNVRCINNGAINGDVSILGNKFLVTAASIFSNGYFYSFSNDNNWYDIVNNLFNQQLIGTMSGPNYTTGNNVVRGTHA